MNQMRERERERVCGVCVHVCIIASGTAKITNPAPFHVLLFWRKKKALSEKDVSSKPLTYILKLLMSCIGEKYCNNYILLQKQYILLNNLQSTK